MDVKHDLPQDERGHIPRPGRQRCSLRKRFGLELEIRDSLKFLILPLSGDTFHGSENNEEY